MKNREYHFKKGQIKFAGWTNIMIFIEVLITILNDIIESDKIKSIEFIPSPFEDET
ncbi:MAG: hypothetical protein ACTHKF_02050 [Candidatus Nitrosocosmicus sp.]